MKRRYDKQPLSFEDQLTRLELRGLRVADRTAAIQSLRRVNYYRLSGYWHIFKREDDSFTPDGSFELAVELYDLDRELRLLVMDMIERVEVAFRCRIAHQLAMDYGAFGHEQRENWSAPEYFEPWTKRLHAETKQSSEVFVKHFKEHYEEWPRLPIWVACEIMSFGQLSKLFKGVGRACQRKIAEPFLVDRTILGSWLHMLSHVRNVCAHHGRLWNRRFSRVKAKSPRNHERWRGLAKGPIQSVFGALCILRHLSAILDDNASDVWALKLVALLRRFPDAVGGTQRLGVPDGWEKTRLWSAVAE